MTIGVSKMVERNYEARETDTDKYSMVVTGVMLADDGRSAVVHVCLWDAVPVFQVRGAPDGTDVLINSERNSQYRKYVVYLEDLHWLVGDTTKLSDIKGRNTCG